MAEQRPYRAGLGIPEAKIIRSSPSFNAPSEPRVYDPSTAPPDHAEWKVNPTRHGPERLRRPPTFLPSHATYDELGRSLIDGVGVEVDAGARQARNKVAGRGADVAEWYSALAAQSSGSSTPRAETDNAEAGPSRPRLPTRVSVEPTSGYSSATTETKDNAPPPLRVKRREWFIRRALLTASQQQAAEKPQPARHPSTIGSMLQLDSGPKPAKPIQYFLGPDNVGHAILRDRLGWEGGGLGRPEGWDEDAWQAHLARTAQQASSPRPAGFAEDVVDLTSDTDDEAMEDDAVDRDASTFASGPGRVAPVATTLKLDRLGIGHRRAKDRKTDQTVKRVTHSQADLREAQRKARFMRPIAREELGKKGKIKWHDKDKRERDERQRLKMALNA